MKQIYLDNNATTPLDPEVFSAMEPYLKETFGNPSSQHAMGAEAKRAVTDSRFVVAEALGAKDGEVVFTSGATESVNMALKGFARAHKREGMHIVTSAIEHECVLETCRVLEEEGYTVTYIKPDRYGWIEPKRVIDAVRDDTVLVAIMHVNNELGTIYDIEEIAREVKTNWNDVTVFADGAQAFGKLSVDLKYIDAYAFSAHKMHGPKGTGGLYIKEGSRIKPFVVGGGQERNMRSGTENVSGIVGLKKATEIAYKHLEEHRAHLKELKDLFLKELNSFDNVVVNSPEDALENTLNVSLVGIPAETLMHALEERGVYISTGSACSTNNKIKSHVLDGIDAAQDIKDSAIRVSFSRMNTHDEVKECGVILKEVISKL